MLRKIYEEIKYLRTELQLMRKNHLISEKKYHIWHEDDIKIETLCAGEMITVSVSFSLDYGNWLKLKKSKKWKRLKKIICEYQKKYNN